MQQHITRVVEPIAKKYNLTLSSFEPAANGTAFQGNGYIQLSVFEGALEPAPHTPTYGAVWDLFAGSARHVLKDEKNDNLPYIISPFASTGRFKRCKRLACNVKLKMLHSQAIPTRHRIGT